MFSLHNFASPQAPEAAARIACLPHGLPQSREQYGCRPENDELAALGGRKPKEIKYLYNRRGRRRSTAQLSVAGVEALPSVAGVEALPRRRISCESVVTAAARRAGAPPPHASSYHHDSCHDACHACLCWTWSHDTCPFSSLFSFSRAATRSSNGRISCSRLFFSVRSQRSIS